MANERLIGPLPGYRSSIVDFHSIEELHDYVARNFPERGLKDERVERVDSLRLRITRRTNNN